MATSTGTVENPDDVNWAMLQLCATTVMLNTAYEPEDVPDAPEPDAGPGTSGHRALFSAARMSMEPISIFVRRGSTLQPAQGCLVRHEAALPHRSRRIRHLLSMDRLTIPLEGAPP